MTKTGLIKAEFIPQNKLVVFQNKEIRRVWHNDEWYYSLVDVVAVLSDSANPTDYLKKIRKRDNELGTYLGTNCPQVELYKRVHSHPTGFSKNLTS